MKRITVTLTEDQRLYVLGLIMMDEDQLSQQTDEPNVKEALAFTKRTKREFLKPRVNVT